MEAKWITSALNELAEQGLERSAEVFAAVGGRIESSSGPTLNFASNDYLNLASRPELKAGAIKALETYAPGACSSRLVTGTLPLHVELERRLALWQEAEQALVFGAGYLANLGVISALLSRGDQIFSDKLVHASIIDGMLLSRAKFKRFRHNDMLHLESLLKAKSKHRRPGERFVVVTESVFSMDGDRAPLEELRVLAEAYDALLVVDEAHALGVFGPCGGGLASEMAIDCSHVVRTGTLSKALASYGGFTSCSVALREFLVNTSRSFIYNTALPPPSCGAAIAALDILREETDAGPQLLARAQLLREGLQVYGFNTLESSTHIVPVVVGGNERVMRLSQKLRGRNVIAGAIRSPTVMKGTERLRLSVTLAHSESDIAQTVQAIAECAKELPSR